MKSLPGFSDPLASGSESPAKCEQCDATTRLGNGVCVSCLLREGLDAEEQRSSESFRKRPRRGGRAGQAMAPRQLRNPRGDRARRDGRDLSRAATALPPDRGAQAHAELSRRFTRNARAFPARSRSCRQPRSSEHSADLRGRRKRGRPAVLQYEVCDRRQPAAGGPCSARASRGNACN